VAIECFDGNEGIGNKMGMREMGRPWRSPYGGFGKFGYIDVIIFETNREGVFLCRLLNF